MEIRLLGNLEVLLDGPGMCLGTPKQQIVLATLAVHPGRLVTLETLVDELWPEDPPRSAVANVRTYAGNLRRMFEKLRRPVLMRLPGGYRLELDDESLDVFRFERLVEGAGRAWTAGNVDDAAALLSWSEELWRGPLLAGLSVGPILGARRASVDEQHLSAIELRARLDVEFGRTREAVAFLTDHVVTHPYREQAHALLARARYADGDPAAALAVIDHAEAVLREHLGVKPGNELQALRQSIVNRADVSLDLRSPAVASLVPPNHKEYRASTQIHRAPAKS